MEVLVDIASLEASSPLEGICELWYIVLTVPIIVLYYQGKIKLSFVYYVLKGRKVYNTLWEISFQNEYSKEMFLYLNGKPLTDWKFSSEKFILLVYINGCILNISHNMTSLILLSTISHSLIKSWLLSFLPLTIHSRGLALTLMEGV